MKPNFLFIATEKDHTAHELHKAALNLGFKSKFYYPAELMQQPRPIPIIDADENTVAMFFWPFTPNKIQQQHQALLEIILENYNFRYVFNDEMHRHSFLSFEDKLYQTYVFDKIGVPHATCVDLSDPEKINYPIIAKKRVSSRSKNNYIISSFDEYERFCQKNDVTIYIFQEYFPLAADYRVIIFQGEVIGIVERKVVIKENNRVTVRVVSGAELPSEVLDYCLRISKFFHCELSGIDVGLKKTGGYFIIEHNGRPQIGKSAKILKQDLPKQIISKIAASGS